MAPPTGSTPSESRDTPTRTGGQVAPNPSPGRSAHAPFPRHVPLNSFCSPVSFGGGRRDLNPQHLEPQSSALPIELHPPSVDCIRLHPEDPAVTRDPPPSEAGGIRTPGPELRRLLLYPPELLPQRDLLSVCRGERIRTSDILLPKQARYQAALRPGSPRSPRLPFRHPLPGSPIYSRPGPNASPLPIFS